MFLFESKMFHWVAGKRKWGKEVRQWLGRVTLRSSRQSAIDSGASGAELHSHIPKSQAGGGLGEVTLTMAGAKSREVW